MSRSPLELERANCVLCGRRAVLFTGGVGTSHRWMQIDARNGRLFARKKFLPTVATHRGDYARSCRRAELIAAIADRNEVQTDDIRELPGVTCRSKSNRMVALHPACLSALYEDIKSLSMHRSRCLSSPLSAPGKNGARGATKNNTTVSSCKFANSFQQQSHPARALYSIGRMRVPLLAIMKHSVISSQTKNHREAQHPRLPQEVVLRLWLALPSSFYCNPSVNWDALTAALDL